MEHPVVAVDMNQVAFPDVQPYLDVEIGRVRVPVRFVSEQIGATVSWENETQTVTISRGELSIVLRVDDPEVIVNGRTVLIDAPPKLVDPGRVMVPLRFVSEVFGASVDWVGDQSPDPRDLAWGKYQVWIWVDWGYWGRYTVDERLHLYSEWFYRGPGR
ncbi:MAG TPA: copper amine oxidase N-terminal domain-containing protein [Symbiobacteriaceae bacterium]|nr:copper amine oxidase N-terminal domain-containing protein [Symbiobacteriaceae bacterium]